MSCTVMRRLLGARLDGRLDRARSDALEAHLAGCPGCQGELGRLEAASRALRAAGPTPVPPGLAERAFRAALAGEARPPEAWFVAAAPRVALAGALAAAAVWAGVLAGGAPRARSAEAAQDPLEVAVLLWSGAGVADGE